jgi:hypothetical protein
MVMRDYRTHRGARVVALGGDQVASLQDWIAEVDRAVPEADDGTIGALLLDFRAQAFSPSADEAGTLIESLRTRFHGRAVPPLAAVARPGAQFGGTRVLCTLAEMRGCRASVFLTEAEAWLWLRARLNEVVRAGPRAGRPNPEAGAG